MNAATGVSPGGRDDPLTYFVNRRCDGNRTALAQPGVMALAGQRDDARAPRHPRAGLRIRPRRPPPRRSRPLHPRLGPTARTVATPAGARDEQRARHLPRDPRRLRRQVRPLDGYVLGVACPVVGIADHPRRPRPRPSRLRRPPRPRRRGLSLARRGVLAENRTDQDCWCPQLLRRHL